MPIKTLLATLALALFLAGPAPAWAQAPGGGPDDDPSLIARGAQLYSLNCGRCHNMRPSSERDDGEWSVIVAHMRARGNLTRTEARALVAFLQATNVDAPGMTAASPPSDPSVASPGPTKMPADETVSLLERIRADDGR